MTEYKVKVETVHINASPTFFRLEADKYYEAFQKVFDSTRFSTVPYFLCCRAIELALKAIHLEDKKRDEVRLLFGHKLWDLYQALPSEQQLLTPDQENLLKRCSEIYSRKDFEYMAVADACTGFKRFPDISALSELTRVVLDFVHRAARGD